MASTANLPTAVPADKTPNVYSGTKAKAFIFLGTDVIVPNVTVTNTLAVSSGATTMTLSTPTNTLIPSGTLLTFGTTQVTTSAAATVTNAGVSVSIGAAPAAIAQGITATYSNLLEIPAAEEITPTPNDMEESINVHGRTTPIRVMNGKDLTANIRTLAGIDDPVVKRLVAKGWALSPNNREKIIWLYDDGFALLATVNIGAPKPQAAPMGSQRYQFTANLAGTLAWSDTTAASPTWNVVNT
ncbi:hypothetical protein GO986_22280 [Deinococcus sp. HMF7620]|uniref:Uncharacterized protein n=1 Tax=Deinococcus arboris TaxID=2682977 RepID=A0A7C9IFI5_9DEIO|nr:hypothetical protein [Deinococcus arboris]MVN89466.1 hypothetical protein [Deinococcus arboris]